MALFSLYFMFEANVDGFVSLSVSKFYRNLFLDDCFGFESKKYLLISNFLIFKVGEDFKCRESLLNFV